MPALQRAQRICLRCDDPKRMKETDSMAFNEVRRGEIYEIQGCTPFGQPAGERFPVLIIQNDTGEIPCETITALQLCGKVVPPFSQGWRVRDRQIHRHHKRQLQKYVGRLSKAAYTPIIEQAEQANGITVPEVLNAP